MRKYKFLLEFDENDLPADEWLEDSQKEDPTLIRPLIELFTDVLVRENIFDRESSIELKLIEYTDK